MFAAQFKIQPTRVNREYVGGPLYHWDRITEDELRLLDIHLVPGPRAGNSVSEAGVTVRRLKDGRVNVVAQSTSPALRAPAFKSFMGKLLAPSATVRQDATMPVAPAYSPAMEAMAMDGLTGRWEMNVATAEFEMHRSAIEIIGTLDLDVPSRISAFLLFTTFGADAPRVRDAIGRAIAAEAPLDITFRAARAGFLRMAGAVVRDNIGKPTRIVGVVSALKYLETSAKESGDLV